MSYTGLDHFIARQRFRAAYPHIRKGARVCDLGCGLDAAFLDFAAARIAEGVGVDDQVRDSGAGKWKRVRADIRKPLPLESGQFDNVVMLAVLEHLVDPEPVLREAHRILAPGGSLILTWPSAMVDPLLKVLHGLRLVSDEMESDEHQKRIPESTLLQILHRIGFTDFLHYTFQWGLNNLMVATR
jgi:SAM-dependent methyltransferase